MLSALRIGRLYLPPKENIPGTHFCKRLRRSHDHSADGGIMSIKNPDDLTGNWTRDLPGCSVAPRPQRTPQYQRTRVLQDTCICTDTSYSAGAVFEARCWLWVITSYNLSVKRRHRIWRYTDTDVDRKQRGTHTKIYKYKGRESWWLCGLRPRFAAARLLISRVRIPLWEWMFGSCV